MISRPCHSLSMTRTVRLRVKIIHWQDVSIVDVLLSCRSLRIWMSRCQAFPHLSRQTHQHHWHRASRRHVRLALGQRPSAFLLPWRLARAAAAAATAALHPSGCQQPPGNLCPGARARRLHPSCLSARQWAASPNRPRWKSKRRTMSSRPLLRNQGQVADGQDASERAGRWLETANGLEALPVWIWIGAAAERSLHP